MFPLSLAVALLAHGPTPRPPAAPATAAAVPASPAPVLDGRDDDPVWRTAPVHSDFRQFAPKQDADPSFRTEFRAAFDRENLYVFVRMYDPHPDSIMHALSRRDVRGPSDQIKLIIDAYHDRRSGVELAVNPDGVKRDFAVFDDGNEDDSWNAVWDVATRVDSLGWTAEFRVPFSQLRYAAAPEQTFGFGIWRDLERYKERDSWPLYSTTQVGLASQLGVLTGIRDIGSPRHVEVSPYMVARNASRVAPGGYDRVQEQQFGADLKLGITPNLTLTGTVNPDFGQVEADPSVVNLSAFETFFSERRPFFVEGTGLYRFELNCYIVHDCGNEGLFYSRRIGRSPHLLGVYGDAGSPTATPILAAGKLTGQSERGFSAGLLEAVTGRVDGTEGRTLEPLTSYAVFRAQQDLNGGDDGFGLIATAVNRNQDEWTADFLRRSAYTVGGHARHRFGNDDYQISGSLVGSRVDGSPEAILATQTDNVHGFQRPDGPARLDPTRTSLTGSSAELIFGKYGGGITRFETAFERQSAGFEPNDLGYLQRADLQSWNTWAALTFRKPHGIYNSLQWNANEWNWWTTDGLRLETAVNTNVHMQLKSNWWLHAGSTLSQLGGTNCDRCSRGGPAMRTSPNWNGWGGINGDDRHGLVPFLWVNLGRGDGGRSTYWNLNPELDFKVSTRLQTSLSASLTHNVDDGQWYGNYTAGAITHYTFAHLDQETLAVTARMSYAATPDLTFDFYAQPFASRGSYADVRELSADPRAPRYEDRFLPFTPPADAVTGFDVRQLRANAIVRWEYRPGSTVYFVWTQARDGFAGTGLDRSWRSEADDLFGLYPANTFLIKLNYWMGR
jgi:hypothetical protein